jgi:tripartite-type tricarboxylate transporter receptor subunit TctC
MVVPFPAGGPTDAIARILAEGMKSTLGQPVIVENLSGGSNGSIGVGRVARANPDGYSVIVGHWGTHVINGALYQLSYDVLEDFAPVALISSSPLVIMAKNQVPAKDLRELIAWLKSLTDRPLYATSGIGSPPHMAGLYLQSILGVKFEYVHYRGAAPSMQDLIAGQVDVSVGNPSAVPQIQSGAVKGFAVTSDRRMDSAPEIPTVDEASLPGFHITSWTDVWAPKQTPGHAIARLNAAMAAALAHEGVRARLVKIGQDVASGSQATPQALRDFQSAEIKKWWPLVKAANLKAE